METEVIDTTFTVRTVEAVKYGLREAIFIGYFRCWILHNKNNEKHFHDGHYWTYNSLDALVKQMPYLTRDQARQVLKSLKDQGVIITGNYNNISFDRTVWYAFKNEDEFLTNARVRRGENSPHRCAENHKSTCENLPHRCGENPTSTCGKSQIRCGENPTSDVVKIPHQYQYINQYNTNNTSSMSGDTPDTPVVTEAGKSVKSSKAKTQISDTEFSVVTKAESEEVKQALKDFCVFRKELKKPITPMGLKIALNKLNSLVKTDSDKVKVIQQSIEHNWQSFYALPQQRYGTQNPTPPVAPPPSSLSPDELYKRLYGDAS